MQVKKKFLSLSARRGPPSNLVEAHYRQGFNQCKLLGLHVQIEHDLFNMVIGPGRGRARISRAPCCTLRVYTYVHISSNKSRTSHVCGNTIVDLILWIWLGVLCIQGTKDRASCSSTDHLSTCISTCAKYINFISDESINYFRY